MSILYGVAEGAVKLFLSYTDESAPYRQDVGVLSSRVVARFGIPCFHLSYFRFVTSEDSTSVE